MIYEREIYLTDPAEKAKVVEFLNGFGLTFTGNIEYTMGLFSDGELVGTGSLGGRVMRDIAIKESFQHKFAHKENLIEGNMKALTKAMEEVKVG